MGVGGGMTVHPPASPRLTARVYAPPSAQGDFLQFLLDRLSPELEKPASKLYKHSVLAVVDAAVHGSNAQFERADILDRLGVRLLQAAEGDTGWDVFSLDYRMESPLTAIVTPAAMDRCVCVGGAASGLPQAPPHAGRPRSYLRAFNFLWRLKRVEHALSGTWTRHMAASRTLAALPGMPAVLHRCQLLRQEMAHCVTTVATYVLVGVIDTAWNGLCDRLTRADSLDDVIDAHTAYLDTINERALLAPSRRHAMQRVRALLDVVLRFCTRHDRRPSPTAPFPPRNLPRSSRRAQSARAHACRRRGDGAHADARAAHRAAHAQGALVRTCRGGARRRVPAPGC